MKHFRTKVFWRLIGFFALLDLTLLLCGCGDWESQATSIITLLGPAIQAILAILAAFGVGVSEEVMATYQKWAQQAQTDLITIKGLVESYRTALASAQPGILNEIQALVTTTATNLATLLPELHITDPDTQQRVMNVFAAIAGMLAAVVALLPALKGEVADNNEILRLYEVYRTTARNFKETFNREASYFGQQYCI